MVLRGLDRPGPDIYPIWAYYRWGGNKHPRPDLRSSDLRSWAKKERHVLMTLDIPTENVLISDHSLWISCLNYWHLGTVGASQAFDRQCKKHRVSSWDSEQFPDNLHQKLLSSWEIILDLNKARKLNRVSKDFQIVQATFWGLRAEDVIGAVEFGNRQVKKVLPVIYSIN